MASSSQQETKDDDDFPPIDYDGGGDVDLTNNDSVEGGDEELTNRKGDWLTSIPRSLGHPATTLESIVHHGSFPPNSTSPAFYHFESQHPGKGAKYLTAKPFDVPPSDVSNEEAEFHLRMTQFLSRLTKPEQEELGYLLLHVYNSREADLSIFKNTRPPTSTEDFNEFYLAGKKSVTKHLPTPVVIKTNDQTHSYVTLTDVIQNMLASSTVVDQFEFETDMFPNGLENDFFDNGEPATISKTRAAYNLFLQLKEEEGGFVLYLWIKRWCDDFDPNNTKQSRNQVWLMTNTICPPPGENQGRNTFFMAIGQKGDDHQEIDQLFQEELRVLSGQGKSFYHGGRREFIRVKAGQVCVCVDRPERSSLYQIGDHGGTYSTLWGHAVDVDPKCEDNCLPSCPFCRRKRLQSHLQLIDAVPLSSTAAQLNSTAVPPQNSTGAQLNSTVAQRAATTEPNSTAAQLNSTAVPPQNSTAAQLNSTADQAASTVNNRKCDQCVSWNVMDTQFTFAAPNDFPTTFDQSPGAPLAPKGREITTTGGQQRLSCIYLTIPWLKEAVIFAHHQLKTSRSPPNQRRKYWTKANSQAFLRTCGINKKLYNAVYDSAKNGDESPPLPYSWAPSNALLSTHYAAMHMLFLGHAKSNFKMVDKFYSHYNLSATFGKQANKYLRDVQSLRCNRFFDAQPLSTSNWGTGVWVSENYLFWVRSIKFFSTLPSIIGSKHVGKPQYDQEIRMVLRFCSAHLAAISRIMSNRKPVGDMEQVVKIYLDSMVEMDRWIHEFEPDDSTAAPVSNTDAPAHSSAAPVNNTAAPATAAAVTRKRKKKTKDTWNFCKSNSLGILSVVEAHQYLGPAVLHWEGGWAGERKIQPAKAQLGIKRANADWQTLALQHLWRDDTLSTLIQKMNKDHDSNEQTRAIEGQLRVYANRATAIDAIRDCKPLSGMLSTDGSVWIAYRPTTDEYDSDTSKTTLLGWSRSAVQLLKLQFKDTEGVLLSHLCWFAPVSVTEGDVMTLVSSAELSLHVDQFVLLLPKLSVNGEYQNMYYGIGSNWTERGQAGLFEQPQLPSIGIFKDWLSPSLGFTDDVTNMEH
jgi:hypothetical protein